MNKGTKLTRFDMCIKVEDFIRHSSFLMACLVVCYSTEHIWKIWFLIFFFVLAWTWTWLKMDEVNLYSFPTQELLNDPDYVPDFSDLSDTQLSTELDKSEVAEPHKCNNDRFLTPLSCSQFQESLLGRIPKNTSTSTKWVLSIWKNWRQWRQFREETSKDEHWPIPTLHEGDPALLDYWLARFITEIRRQDNEPYPPGILCITC